MKYLLILLSGFIVFTANAAPTAKDVNVVNTPGVTIENVDPVPVVQSRPQRTPYNFDANIWFPSNSDVAELTFTPSTDGRLVVETFTYSAHVGLSEILRAAQIRTWANGVYAIHNITIPEGRVIGSQIQYDLAIPLRLYADPDTDVTILFSKLMTSPTGGGNAQISLSGYSIPADATSLAP